MNLRLTQSQLVALLVCFSVMALLALMPYHGAPHFRYTGSDPVHHVWNLGWPITTCVFDAANPPYFFAGPFAYVFAIAGLGALLSAYATFVARNNLAPLQLRPKWKLRSGSRIGT